MTLLTRLNKLDDQPAWDWEAVHDALAAEIERRGMEAEPISKPYTMETLPDRVKAMPKGAQRIWLAAFNSAEEQYENESQWFAVANAAVGNKYHKVDGRWRLKKGNGEDELQVRILKYDEDEFQGYCYGVVLEPGEIDTQQDIIGVDEIRKAAHSFLRHGAKLDLQHMEDISADDATSAESYLAPVDFDCGGEIIKEGSWVLVVKLHSNELRKGVREGDITGYSIKGTGYRKTYSGDA
jgi:cation transport regulator ChaB